MGEQRATLSAKVTPEFLEAVSFFAGLESLTVSSFTKSALQRRASHLIKERFALAKEKRRLAELMKTAVDDGSWAELAKKGNELYPKTKDLWLRQISQCEATANTVLADVKEMTEKIGTMGITMI